MRKVKTALLVLLAAAIGAAVYFTVPRHITLPDGIASIDMSYNPGGTALITVGYSDPAKIAAVADYFERLPLRPTSYDPDSHSLTGGGRCALTLTDAAGSTYEIIHYTDWLKFDGQWYTMRYDDRNAFYDLVKSTVPDTLPETRSPAFDHYWDT